MQTIQDSFCDEKSEGHVIGLTIIICTVHENGNE